MEKVVDKRCMKPTLDIQLDDGERIPMRIMMKWHHCNTDSDRVQTLTEFFSFSFMQHATWITKSM